MKRGSILIFAIWILILLTMFAASIGFRSRIGIQVNSFHNSSQDDYFQFLSMINLASFYINSDEDPVSDSSQDPWYGTPRSFAQHSLASKFDLIIKDEESKLNINKVTEVVLQNFLKVLSENDIKLKTKSEDLIGSIVMWRGGTTLQGKAGIGFQHKRAPFESLDELYLIQHIDPSDVSILKEYITVYGRTFDFSLRVNLNTVHDWILEAIVRSLAGGDSSKKLLINQIQLYRKGDPKNPQKYPALTFISNDLTPAKLIEKLKLPNSPEMVAMVSQFAQFVVVDSQFFHILVVTKDDTFYQRETEAILGLRQQILVKSSKGSYSLQPRLNNVLNGYPFEILYWNDKRVMR